MESLKCIAERGVVIASRHRHTTNHAYDTWRMSMGRQKRARQPLKWIMAAHLPTVASHRFYWRLNQLPRERGFDDFADAQSAAFYAETMGRPGLPPGIY